MKSVPIIVKDAVDVAEGGSLEGLWSGQAKSKATQFAVGQKATASVSAKDKTVWRWLDWEAQQTSQADDGSRTVDDLNKEIAHCYPGQTLYDLVNVGMDLLSRSQCRAAHKPAGAGKLTDLQAEATRFYILRFPLMKADYQAAVKVNSAGAFLKQVYAADHEQIDAAAVTAE
jgi:hypothetical protein